MNHPPARTSRIINAHNIHPPFLLTVTTSAPDPDAVAVGVDDTTLPLTLVIGFVIGVDDDVPDDDALGVVTPDAPPCDPLDVPVDEPLGGVFCGFVGELGFVIGGLVPPVGGVTTIGVVLPIGAKVAEMVWLPVMNSNVYVDTAPMELLSIATFAILYPAAGVMTNV